MHQIIVSYDISDKKKRKKLYEELLDIGLVPIQKSVFWGYALTSEKRVVKNLFKKYCDKDTDRAFVINTVIDKDMDSSFGYKENFFKKPDGFEVLTWYK